MCWEIINTRFIRHIKRECQLFIQLLPYHNNLHDKIKHLSSKNDSLRLYDISHS